MYFNPNIQKIVFGGRCDPNLLPFTFSVFSFLRSKALLFSDTERLFEPLGSLESRLPQVTRQGFIHPHAQLFWCTLMD